jgi:hypothetical protein
MFRLGRRWAPRGGHCPPDDVQAAPNGAERPEGKGKGEGEGKGRQDKPTSSPVASSPEKKPQDPNSPTPEEFMAEWNRVEGFQQIREMTEKRVKALRARTQDPGFRSRWREGIAMAGKTSFCKGGGSQGWRADVDWFLRPDTLTRILEGAYCERKPAEKMAETPEQTEARIAEQNAEYRRRDGKE